MPLLRTNQTLTLAVTATHDEIKLFTVDNNGQRISIIIAHGNLGRDGKLVETAPRTQASIVGADFLALARKVTSGGTFFSEIKSVLYNQLIAQGDLDGVMI